jgi:hypothetical protein
MCAAQIRHDRGQRRADDRLVERGEQHAQHDRHEDNVAAPPVQYGRLRRGLHGLRCGGHPASVTL